MPRSSSPSSQMIEDAGVRGKDERPAEAYLRVACERYRLIREHEWNAEVMDAVTSKGKQQALSRSRARP